MAGLTKAMDAVTQAPQLVAGRLFDDHDQADTELVIIVDQRLAQRFWPNQDPIGRRMFYSTAPGDPVFTVVGVVHELKLGTLVEGEREVGTYYLPFAQGWPSPITFAVRTSAAPAAFANTLRSSICALDPELAVFDLRTMNDWETRSLIGRRAAALLSMGFGGVALFLSVVGIYGTLAYLVTLRRKEIGIRLALGSSTGGVLKLMLREGLFLVACGLAAGTVGTFGLKRTLESQLFGLTAADPLVLSTSTVLVAVVALAACFVPAWRATRIDPKVALAD